MCGARQNFYMFSLYRNTDRDDRIYDCLLTAVVAMQAADAHASCSTTTNRHGVAALDFATVSGCVQLVIGPTHARGGTLDLPMTDVPDQARVPVIAPLGN